MNRSSLVCSFLASIFCVCIAACQQQAAVSGDMESRWDIEPCTRQESGEFRGEITIRNQTPACRIALRPTSITLATEQADPELPIVELSNGHFAAPTSGRDQFAIWSSDGKLLRTIGRQGGGPGYFTRVSALYVGPSGDTLYIADGPDQLEVFSSSGEWIRGGSMPDLVHYEHVAALRDGKFLVASVSPASPWAFAVVGPVQGDLSSSIPSEAGSTPIPTGARQVAYAGGSTFWTVSSRGYDLELWDLDGTKRATIRREVDWYPEVAKQDTSMKQPYIATFALDDNQVLWVATVVHARPGRRPPLGQPFTEDVRESLDLHVEAFDTRNGELLVSERLDDPYRFLPPPLLAGGRGIQIRPDQDGVLRARVVEYKLVRAD